MKANPAFLIIVTRLHCYGRRPRDALGYLSYVAIVTVCQYPTFLVSLLRMDLWSIFSNDAKKCQQWVMRVCVSFNPDGDAGRTQRFILVQAQHALRPVWGWDLYYPTPKVLVVGVTSTLRERECVPGLGLMWLLKLGLFVWLTVCGLVLGCVVNIMLLCPLKWVPPSSFMVPSNVFVL